MYKNCSSIYIVHLLLGPHGARDRATRPKLMPHGTPWILGVCAEEARAIFTGHESGSSFFDGQVTDVVLVGCRLDRICGAIFTQRYRHIVGKEARTGLVETMIAEGIRAPLMLSRTIMIIDLGVELTGRAHTPTYVSTDYNQKVVGYFSHDIAVDDLGHTCYTFVGREIKRLCFHTSAFHGMPFQMLRLDFGIRGCFGLLGDGLNGTWAIIGLLSASNICQTDGFLSAPEQTPHVTTHVFFSQFMMV